MAHTQAYEPAEFGTEEFLTAYRARFDRYIALRAAGKTADAALRVAFDGMTVRINTAPQWYIDHIECSDYYMTQFAAAVRKIKTATTWNPAIAVQQLATVAFDTNEKGITRVAAMKELNVICGVTVQEDGQTKRGPMTLDDFAKLEAEDQRLQALAVASAKAAH